jgi:signal transduction histidine kinase
MLRDPAHNAMSAAAAILVVDDNEQNRALAEAALEDEGHRVITAGSGEEGIRAFEAEHPDCVLLDVRMPGTDGLAACARIRSLPGGKDTPIIFLTAQRDVDTFDRALAAGGDDFLTKPVRPAELIARVRALLEARRMSSELRAHYELIRKQRDDLMRLQLQKERLTALIVHDLKNPVNSMDLHAQVLLRNPELPESARESVLHIREGARSLARLVMNLLDISKSEEGKLVARPVALDLTQLARELRAALELRAQTSGVRLELAIDVPAVHADPDLLRRVLENLIENAIRHAPEGSAVRLAAREAEGAVELRVSDAGPGVAPELREKIFEPFVQVDNGDRVVARSGRGLGLTFCKLAAVAHGGRIWVEDANPGAAFCLRIPHGS